MRLFIYFLTVSYLLQYTRSYVTSLPVIAGLTLVRVPSTELGPLPAIIYLWDVGTSLSIKVEISSGVPANFEGVRFYFDGNYVTTERHAPFCLQGDYEGTYFESELLKNPGHHSITLEAVDTNWKVMEKQTVYFIIEDTASPTPAPTKGPTKTPTKVPTKTPTKNPTKAPTRNPTKTPTKVPAKTQTKVPTKTPTRAPIAPGPTIRGQLRKWHKITLAFTGPFASETSTTLNPFMDYRLDVTFYHPQTNTTYKVPGYFAADGNAAETSANSGTQWHCHFSPDRTGIWQYTAAFVTGANVSVSTTAAGRPLSFNGQRGTFSIQPTNKTGRDHRGKGRLRYVGQHHLQFAENGEWFLKVGPDSPENFLAYVDFDNTPNNQQRRKTWGPHIKDYVVGDSTWKGGKGKGIIGAINYLSKQGMNVFSFLTMNINGDDKNVYPYTSPTDFFRMDVSKLAQWEKVFEHADKMGMFLHFKTAEQENDQLLDGGNLGNARKLYYRELIARFGHHLALNWNLAEEITNTVPQIKTFSDYFKQNDPYKNLVITHTMPDSNLYVDLLGYNTFDGASLQTLPIYVFRNTLRWVKASAAAKRKWVVTNDEQRPAISGVVPDTNDPNHDVIRQQVLWGNIMAGGSGVEYFFGYNYTNSDLTCEDLSSRQNIWSQSRYAIEFFYHNTIPFWEMYNNQSRIRNNNVEWILSNPNGTIHVIYRQSTTPTTISTTGIKLDGLIGTYLIYWYNPRTGGSLLNGPTLSIKGGSTAFVSYGSPPINDGKDWVILLRKV